jgi:hypothetical protein
VFRGHGSFEQQEEREIAIRRAILSPRSLTLARLRMTGWEGSLALARLRMITRASARTAQDDWRAMLIRTTTKPAVLCDFAASAPLRQKRGSDVPGLRFCRPSPESQPLISAATTSVHADACADDAHHECRERPDERAEVPADPTADSGAEECSEFRHAWIAKEIDRGDNRLLNPYDCDLDG